MAWGWTPGEQRAFRDARQFAILLLREPLFRFLVIGAALFGVYGVIGGDSPEAESQRITISTAEIELLRGRWMRQWLRAPSEEELQALVEERVREEVLYREALAMGLDRDDSMIRQRLAQKLKFLTEDVTLAREPSASELEAYFAANGERYRLPPLLSFSQVFFRLEGRGLGVASNAPFRDGAPSVYEGGVHVPAIFRWPGKIEPGTECREMLSHLDVLPLASPPPAHGSARSVFSTEPIRYRRYRRGEVAASSASCSATATPVPCGPAVSRSSATPPPRCGALRCRP